ncbi:MAG: hypothetical protein Q9160_001505 [Pyrenula sp. 1 TL-2023]
MDDFPRTVRDAIQVTRRLGLRFLWVDSLCIVQDDKIDWAKEAASMSDIYANSTLTIAAVGASDNGKGLFVHREPLSVLPCFLFQDYQGTDYYADNMEVMMDHVFTRDAPLYGRGWVLQERFLSRRTLGYGKRAITWDCREKLVSDTFIISHLSIEGPEKRFLQDMHKGRAHALKTLRLKSPNQNFALEQEALDIWNEIVSDYSRTSLTFVTDKMIAITGLITVFEDITGWRNIHGLWEPFLLNQLLWSPRDRRIHANVVKPTGGVAPSWSWACSTGDIVYETFTSIGFKEKNRVFAAEIEVSGLSSPSPSPSTDAANPPDTFALTLQTYLFDAQIIPGDTSRSYGDGNERIDISLPRAGNNITYEKGTLSPDWPDLPTPTEQYFFVPLCMDEEPIMAQLFGLCVKRSRARDRAYERCGMVVFSFWGGGMGDLRIFTDGERGEGEKREMETVVLV